jgi:hypothetical protein
MDQVILCTLHNVTKNVYRIASIRQQNKRSTTIDQLIRRHKHWRDDDVTMVAKCLCAYELMYRTKQRLEQELIDAGHIVERDLRGAGQKLSKLLDKDLMLKHQVATETKAVNK